MKKLTVKKQVLSLCAFLLFVQGVIAWVGHSSLSSVSSHLYSVFNKRLPSIDNLVQADRDFQQMLVAERSLLLENLGLETKKALLADYIKNRNQVLERFEKFQSLGLSDDEKIIAESFLKNYKLWLESSKQGFIFENDELKSVENKSEMIQKSLSEISTKFEQARTDLDKLQELILQYGETEFQAAENTYNNSIKFIIFFSLGSIVFSLIIGFYISRNIDNNITKVSTAMKREGDSLDHVSEVLGEKSTNLSSISQELTSAVTETTSSLHEISQMIKSNTEGSSTVASLVDQSRDLVNKGVSLLSKLGGGIKSVEVSSANLTKTVESSNHELAEIIKVFEEVKEKTNVINDIVFQTNLLSFNASVEAARAGENGKGFSVVAEEVGNLAKMSGTAADEISSLLGNSLDKVTRIVEESGKEINSSMSESKVKIEESVSLSSECQNIFNSVLKNFEAVSANSSEVAAASKEQLAGVEEVSNAMIEITAAANQTNQSSSDVETASHDLKKAVKEISVNITDLESLV